MSESYGFLSTYPPTQCGLATFTASLAAGLRDGSSGTEVGVVRVVERPGHCSPAEVVHELISTSPGGEAAAAAALDEFDVAIIQHEYGIYGGLDGDSVIEIMRRLRAPAVVVLHTVLVAPTRHQRWVLEQVVACASAVVVMTETARRRLLTGYAVDPAKIVADRPRRPDRLGHPRAQGGRRHLVDPDVGSARAGQGHRVGGHGPRRSSATSTRYRATSSPERPIPRCSSATGSRIDGWSRLGRLRWASPTW